MSDTGVGPERDEELPQPHRRTDPRRLRLELVFAAAVLLVVAIVARGLGHDGSSTAMSSPPASPSSSRSDGLSVATDFVTMSPIPGGYLPQPAGDAVRCPADCVTIHAVSRSVRAAITDAFPGAQITAMLTVRLEIPNFGQANWSLHIEARVGNRALLLQVRGSAQGDRGGYEQTLFGGHAISRLQTTLVQYHVLVQVVAPAGEQQPRAPLEQLAHDVRLFDSW